MGPETSPEWTKQAVLETLASSDVAEPGLQAFLDRDLPKSEVEAVARAIVAEAGGEAAARIGPVSALGKSFAVYGDRAVLRRIAEDPRVKSVLPTAVDDILPKPVPEKAMRPR